MAPATDLVQLAALAHATAPRAGVATLVTRALLDMHRSAYATTALSAIGAQVALPVQFVVRMAHASAVGTLTQSLVMERARVIKAGPARSGK